MKYLIAVGLLISHCCFAQSGTTTSTVQELKKLAPALLRQGNVTGLSLAYIKNGEIVWAQSFGYANGKSKTPLTSKSIFEAASLSKPLFAYAVLRLAEQGKIDLNKPLIQYLPEAYVSDTVRLKRVTALHCLTHTTGFPNWRPSGEPLKFYNTPGEKFSYSGEGVNYLQKVIEHIEKKPLNDIMQELIYKPLGMTQTSYTWRPEYETVKVYPHDFQGTPTDRIKPATASAASSLHTTATDYARFVKSLLNADLLETESYKKLLTAYVQVEEECVICPARTKQKLSKELAWGLGVGLQQSGEEKAFWHWGDNGNTQAFMMGRPGTKDGIVILGNSANLLPVVDKIISTAFEKEAPALAWLKIVPYDRAERLAVNSILYSNKVDRKTITPLTYNQLNWVAFTLLKADKPKEAIEVLKSRIDSAAISDSYYGLALAYMMNKNGTDAMEYCRKAVALNARNTNARELLQQLEDESRVLDPSLIQQYTGKYKTKLGEAVITARDGHLYFQGEGGSTDRMIPRSETTFSVKTYGVVLTFEKEKNKVKGFSFLLNNERLEAQKVQ